MNLPAHTVCHFKNIQCLIDIHYSGGTEASIFMAQHGATINFLFSLFSLILTAMLFFSIRYYVDRWLTSLNQPGLFSLRVFEDMESGIDE
jgi:hypothetical protein